MRHRIIVSSRALREIDRVEHWWQRNRHKAPEAVGEELEKAIDLLRKEPGVGTRVRTARLTGVRRLWLERIKYDLYYRVDERGQVELLSLWHSRRRRKPRL